MSDTQTALDPMTLRVLGGAFGAIAKEMAQVIFRTAFFQIIREAEDLGAGLYTADGDEISESETTAMHCGSIGAYMRGLNEIWGDDIAEGDVFLHNDPAPRRLAHRRRVHRGAGVLGGQARWRGPLTPRTSRTSVPPPPASAPTPSTTSPTAATTPR